MNFIYRYDGSYINPAHVTRIGAPRKDGMSYIYDNEGRSMGHIDASVIPHLGATLIPVTGAPAFVLRFHEDGDGQVQMERDAIIAWRISVDPDHAPEPVIGDTWNPDEDDCWCVEFRDNLFRFFEDCDCRSWSEVAAHIRRFFDTQRVRREAAAAKLEAEAK